MNRHSLCGVCAATEFSELRQKQSQDLEQDPNTRELSSLFNADSNEQYRRRYNVRLFRVKEEADEDVYQNVVEVQNASKPILQIIMQLMSNLI